MTIKLAPKQVLIALDINSLDEATNLLSLLDKDLFRLKIGKQLFTSEGPAGVEKLIGMGFDVFLDLKLHDKYSSFRWKRNDRGICLSH